MVIILSVPLVALVHFSIAIYHASKDKSTRQVHLAGIFHKLLQPTQHWRNNAYKALNTVKELQYGRTEEAGEGVLHGANPSAD